MTTKLMVIYAGLPGGGKSTAAAQMKEGAQILGQTCVICSTDDFFVVDGVYTFNPGKLFQNHLANQRKARQACVDDVNVVVIDNTNILAKHREAYENIAAEFGYKVETVVVGQFTEEFAKICAERNKHGVPLASIQKMARQFQPPTIITAS